MKRALPKYIQERRYSYVVRMDRGPLKLRAWFPKSDPQGLARATAKVRQFEQLTAGMPLKVWSVPARSNTGVVGISEGVKWIGQHRYDCFAVTWRETVDGKRKQRCKRFLFGANGVGRDVAFRKAVAWRAGKVGGLAGEPVSGNGQADSQGGGL